MKDILPTISNRIFRCGWMGKKSPEWMPVFQEDIRETGRAAVREAVLRSAVECYTLEGAYPESLEYLEKHYGLTVNKKEYIVTYEVFADNQLPTVQVLVRGEE